MIKRHILAALLSVATIPSIASGFSVMESLTGERSIVGDASNGKYLYVTASPKIYSIGNQLGQFPKVGWHIKDEMGGIWMHPIKLMDGFEFSINGHSCDKAQKFITYPYATQFVYEPSRSMEVTRTDFAFDDIPVIVAEIAIKNMSDVTQTVNLSSIVHCNLMPTWLSERCGVSDGEDIVVSSGQNMVVLKDKSNNWFA